MKKRICSIVLCFIMSLGIAQIAFAEEAPKYEQPMYFYFDSDNIGYNSSPGYKELGNPCAYVSLSSGTIGKTTNYLVIDASGTQISEAKLLTFSGPNSFDYLQLWYYSSAHEGIVYLRANTGGTGAGYYVSGQWAASFRP